MNAKEKVIQEYTELNTKHKLLENFIDTKEFYDLPVEQRSLLRIQESIMKAYCETLARRLNIWEDK